MQKHLLKEYIQLMVLDYLASTAYISKLAFIGGTNLRLVKGIDRFSEDLYFDCKQMSEQEFVEMTDSVISFLQKSGLNVVARDKANAKLTAFRRNIYFPEFLFELGLSGHKEERFLLKIEAQDQGTEYPIEIIFRQLFLSLHHKSRLEKWRRYDKSRLKKWFVLNKSPLKKWQHCKERLTLFSETGRPIKTRNPLLLKVICNAERLFS